MITRVVGASSARYMIFTVKQLDPLIVFIVADVFSPTLLNIILITCIDSDFYFV